MRPSIARSVSLSLSIAAVFAAGCGSAEEAGRAAAQKQAAEETKREVSTTAAVKVVPPVPGTRPDRTRRDGRSEVWPRRAKSQILRRPVEDVEHTDAARQSA